MLTLQLLKAPKGLGPTPDTSQEVGPQKAGTTGEQRKTHNAASRRKRTDIPPCRTPSVWHTPGRMRLRLRSCADCAAVPLLVCAITTNH